MTRRSNGSRRAYRSGTKETWRNTVWNIMADEVPPDRPIIYLAGPEDNDRLVALRHGIEHHRLVAIDTSEENIRRRVKGEHGGLGLDERLEDVAWAWPDSWPVGAVVADFCGGWTKALVAFLLALARPAFHGCVVTINLLRGRDPLVHEVFPGLGQDFGRSIESWQKYADEYRAELARARSACLRGATVRDPAQYGEWVKELKAIVNIMDWMHAAHPLSRARLAIGHLWGCNICAIPLGPLLHYRSDMQMFDSAVFQIRGQGHWLGWTGFAEHGPRIWREECQRFVGETQPKPAVARRITAIRAVSTMRRDTPGPLIA